MLFVKSEFKNLNTYLASLVSIHILIFYARFQVMISLALPKRVKYIGNVQSNLRP